ncbi:MAG TPA: uracil-DNA glycosylase [Candidatus Saccharimonadales bacterium]|nr:uracil-DNA glycosylase [Candidatus Saccharimonadales bacterium]
MDKAAALQAVAGQIQADNVCPELREGATQLVFADGSADVEIMFVGEAPGANEDKQGKPFVGAAGKFLNEMLSGIGLTRQDVYITNIVKYRPPGNRDPQPAEIQAFMPYLKQQIDIIKPQLIVFLGRHAMNVFLPELKISQAHGRALRKSGHVYLPLFHPAAALYNGGMRQTLIDDFSQIPAILKNINSQQA